jgi:2-dehydropantoate 2-reductase
MRFVICGAGAIGGVIGGQLAKAGCAVIFIEKNPAHASAIKQHGLQLKGVHGEHTLHIPVVSHAAEVGLRDSDSIFLAVKSFHSAAAAAELRQAADGEPAIFCAQNGVGNEAVVAGYFQRVHGVMVLTAAKHMQPGEVVQTGNGPVGLGTYPSGVSRVARDVAAALDATDLPIYTTANVLAAKWNKLLLNLNNATMGLTGLASEEGFMYPEVRQWMADVWE